MNPVGHGWEKADVHFVYLRRNRRRWRSGTPGARRAAPSWRRRRRRTAAAGHRRPAPGWQACCDRPDGPTRSSPCPAGRVGGGHVEDGEMEKDEIKVRSMRSVQSNQPEETSRAINQRNLPSASTGTDQAEDIISLHQKWPYSICCARCRPPLHKINFWVLGNSGETGELRKYATVRTEN